MSRAKKLGLLIAIVAAIYGAAFIAKEIVLKDAAPLLQSMKAEESCGQPYLDKRYTEALEPCRRAAELGSPMARTMLGEMYYYGYGVEKDLVVAYDYALAAANEPHAQFLLGRILMSKNFSGRNLPQAEEWLSKAAMACHQQATLTLVLAHQTDNLFGTDLVESYKWSLLLTSQQITENAKNARDKLAARLSDDERQEATEAARVIKANGPQNCE